MSGSEIFNNAAFFFLLIFLKLSLCFCFNHNASIILCPEIEKQALLGLKETLEDPSNRLLSWSNGEPNCCNFKGVVCGNLINGGHVLQLRLRGYNLTGKLSPSMLNLTYLKHLDLSYNDFRRETIPSFLGSFMALEYLNLTYSKFGGIIPHTIGNLSNLRVLSLSGWQHRVDIGNRSPYHALVAVGSIEWLLGLDQLEHLDMNSVDLSGATNWMQLINKLPSLKELHLKECSLNFLAPLDVVNTSALSFLDLSWNEFYSSIPRWLFQLTNLVHLDIGYNFFTGPIPNISNTTKLQHIDLSSNYYINSTIPDWVYLCKDLLFVHFSYNTLHDTIYSDIGNLSSLSYLDLSSNDLSGKLPTEIGDLTKMCMLDLSENKLHGEIPYSYGNLSNLETMDARVNQLGGALPTSLGKLVSLKFLGLSFNKLSGNFPELLLQLFNLESLYISDNMFRGVVTENHLVNLTNLEWFVASGNHLTLKVKPNWIPPFQLQYLRMRSWNLGPNPQIPSWLKTQRKMHFLDLSEIGMSGTIPNWIWKIPYLNLSHNNLHGNVPDISENRKSFWLDQEVLCRPSRMSTPDMYDNYISLSSNQLSGPLPRVSDHLKALDLSNNSFTGSMSHFLCSMANESSMLILQLNENKLSGKLPDCWMNFPFITVLNLGNNSFFGSIPNSLGIPMFYSLTLYGNKFSGQIPCSLLNSTYLSKIDLGNNDLEGNIPTCMGTSSPYLRFLILQSNKLSGGIPLELCHIQSLQVLDLSNNNFFGIIPWCFNNFTTMVNKTSLYNIPYSNGHYAIGESVDITTKGRRWHYESILYLVIYIDLSMNNLSGEIPTELTSLAELRFLNLSGNHLTGLIPNNIGDMKQLEALDLSRNDLSGKIPNSFTVMFALNLLNLSYNKLTGKIPESTQLRGMDPSSFAGTNLCGPPLTRNCSQDLMQTHKELNIDHKPNVQWFYVFVSLGYVVGLSLVCSLLVLKKSWRVTLFGFVEDMWDAIYVYFHIEWRRLQRRLG